jgi:hypothetical protein
MGASRSPERSNQRQRRHGRGRRAQLPWSGAAGLEHRQLPVRLAYVPGLLAFREVTVMQATLDGPVPRPTWRCMT